MLMLLYALTLFMDNFILLVFRDMSISLRYILRFRDSQRSRKLQYN